MWKRERERVTEREKQRERGGTQREGGRKKGVEERERERERESDGERQREETHHDVSYVLSASSRWQISDCSGSTRIAALKHGEWKHSALVVIKHSLGGNIQH